MELVTTLHINTAFVKSTSLSLLFYTIYENIKDAEASFSNRGRYNSKRRVKKRQKITLKGNNHLHYRHQSIYES